jgi:nucleotide-binding universal stress UspA family protein
VTKAFRRSTRLWFEADGVSMTQSRAVVVGVDASPGGQLALRWATAEAAKRELPMEVVVAYERPVTSLTPTITRAVEAPASTKQVYEAAVAFVADRLGSERVTGVFEAGRAAALLVERSAEAELLVVGSRSRSTLASVVLGSVSSAVAAHASCPVVVVRGAPTDANRIVVGVDGSPESDHALAFAFEEAGLRGWSVDAIFGWQAMEAIDPAVWTSEKAEEDREGRRRELRERVLPYEQKHPAVAVTTHVIEGQPAAVLAAASRTASLVVVGSRGRGGIAGLLLGSVSQGVLHHGHCAIAIARGRAGAGPAADDANDLPVN